QKAREIYGLLEKQFRRFFSIASKTPGVTGDTLVQLLERRLDNTVYRAGLAHSRPQARQLVRHGHFQVNGRRTDIPSYLVKPGDILAWGPQGLNSQYLKDLKENPVIQPLPAWLSRDEELTTIKVITMPSREEGESAFDAKAIVEFYAR
ncbi:MAG: 30S ribosomal protein S4, partial [Chloroflexota bacterium]